MQLNQKMKKGFTFIELLIAVSIFAVVAIALYSTFFAGISVWKRSSEGGNIYQNIKFVLDDICRDLKNAVKYTKEEESDLAFSGANDEIAFVTLEPSFSEDNTLKKELTKVVYRFDREEKQLIRQKAGKSSSFDAEKTEKEILLEDLGDLKFEYCYDSGDEDEPYLWKEEWEHKDMEVPRGVKLTFSIKAEKGEKEALEFTRTMFIPIGVLGEKEIGL